MALVSRVNLPCKSAHSAAFRQSRHIVVENAIPEETASLWRAHAAELIASHGLEIRRDSGGQLLTYRVVTGEIIRDLWPELYELYTAAHIRDWIRSITGERDIYLSRNQRSCININIMSHRGESYRWHFDAVPYTLLLFLTTSAEEDGGAFEMSPPPSATPAPDVRILPRAGTIVLMDGSSCRHQVAPLLRDSPRITVPMVYPSIADDSRPEGLDDYLYRGD